MKVILFTLIMIGIIQGCVPDGVWGPDIKNDSDDTIIVTYGMKRISKHKWKVSTEFPEVSFEETINPHHYVDLIFPYASYRNVKSSPQDTISVFIMNPDTVRAYTWKEIAQGQKFIRKYTKTIQEFHDSAPGHFFLVYTPAKLPAKK